MGDIISINKVGVIINSKGQFLCWNNNECEFYLSNNIKDAQRVVGDKRLNYSRLLKLAKKSDEEFSLIIGDYAYYQDDSKSGFISFNNKPAVVYEYLKI